MTTAHTRRLIAALLPGGGNSSSLSRGGEGEPSYPDRFPPTRQRPRHRWPRPPLVGSLLRSCRVAATLLPSPPRGEGDQSYPDRFPPARQASAVPVAPALPGATGTAGKHNRPPTTGRRRGPGR